MNQTKKISFIIAGGCFLFYLIFIQYINAYSNTLPSTFIPDNDFKDTISQFNSIRLFSELLLSGLLGWLGISFFEKNNY